MKKLLILLTVTIVASSCKENQPKRALPFIGNFDVEYKMVDGVEVADTVYPKMIDFTYLNQDSNTITNKDFANKVWIADFFFTSCPTICPTMTTQMKRVAKATEDLSNDLQLLSFSIDPKRDTPSRLTSYRKKYNIMQSNWAFLTGDEAKTHKLGIEHFQLFAGQDENSAGGYAHSPAFTLVDKEGYVRGVYVGTETKDVDRLIEDVRKLLKIEYGISGSK